MVEDTKKFSIVNKQSGKAEEVLNLIDGGTFVTAQTPTIGVRFEKKTDEEGNVESYENDSFTLIDGEPVDAMPAAPADEAKPEAVEVAAEEKVEDVEVAADAEVKADEANADTTVAPADEVAADTTEAAPAE